MPEQEQSNNKGLSSSRIETLSDGVFSIAMTLLVLNLKIVTGLGHQAFLESIKNLWPQLAAYAVSFMVLAVYWIGHHNQFFWIKKSDRTFLWINVFFLMSISFVPFATSLLAAYTNELAAVFIYGTNVIVAGLMLYIHWWYASGPGGLVEGYLDADLKSITATRILIGIGFYVVSVLAAFISTKISLALFAVLPFLYMRSSKVDRFLKTGSQ